jgi:uncharacterized damage-inducible protein DinB
MNEAEFDLGKGIEILRRTPKVLCVWLEGLSDGWIRTNEGPETWSPFDVLGHLVHGERTDWIPRAQHILAGKGDEPFQPFDRFAQFHESEGKGLDELLDEFEEVRGESLETLEGLQLGEAELELTGTHPEFGSVTLRQLLATWVTHDLAHLAQIARVMARQQQEAVGPWEKYLSVLHRR